MSLETIVDRILGDARAEAERIVSDARAKAEAAKEEARANASRLADELLKQAEKEGRLEASRIVTQARLEKKIEILGVRRELIAEVLKRAFEKQAGAGGSLRKTVILKAGEKEEAFSREMLLDEIHPKLETIVLDLLKI
jgi:vacuolar-type H+-ATPase subunit H